MTRCQPDALAHRPAAGRRLGSSIRIAAVVAIACVAAGVAASQQTPPRFRAIRQLIRFDVTVLDDQRRPVTDLNRSDFELLENGVPREIAAFSRIDVPGPAAAPPWALDAPHDVVENRTDVRRLIVIVIDDAANAFDAAVTRRLKDIARRIVRRLGPHDLTAIVFTADNRRPEDFTVDRSRLLGAIDRAGQGWGGAAHPLFSLYSIDTLTKAAEYLTELPEKRKAILYISQGVGGESALPALSGRGQSDRIGTSLSRLLQTADRANVSVYAIDPSATSGLSDPGRTLQMAYLQVLSLSTGGFAVQPEDLDGGIARVFRAISSYT